MTTTIIFFRRKKHFPELEEKEKTHNLNRTPNLQSYQTTQLVLRPKELFFEALKLENQILNLSISERKFGMI